MIYLSGRSRSTLRFQSQLRDRADLCSCMMLWALLPSLTKWIGCLVGGRRSLAVSTLRTSRISASFCRTLSVRSWHHLYRPWVSAGLQRDKDVLPHVGPTYGPAAQSRPGRPASLLALAQGFDLKELLLCPHHLGDH